MHEDYHKLTSPKPNPCLQIMFNINSKNCVNNNIIANVDRNLDIDMASYHASKNDQTPILANKKHTNQCHTKNNKNTPNKTYTNNPKLVDLISQYNLKSNKKNIQTLKSNISPNTTLKSTKQNSNLQKNISGTFTKSNFNQDLYLTVQKKSKRTKSNIDANKQMRQKIIELMIKDYEKGKISADNLKVAISSLIEKQTHNLRLNSKGHSKTQKSRVQIPNNDKSSLVNTPRNIPAKSKSQKTYQPSLKCGNKIKRLDDSPQIIQRVIERKDFASKIVIKGIISSLFLSNEWTTNDSPKKEKTVDVNIINTSDSVKDLKKEMQKVSTKNYFIKEDNPFNGNDKNHQEGVDKKSNSETKQILDFYLQKFENLLQIKNSEVFQNFYNKKQFIEEQNHSSNDQQDKGSKIQEQSSDLEKFQFIEGLSIESKLKKNLPQIQPLLIEQESVINSVSSNNDIILQQPLESQQKIKCYLSSDLKLQDKRFTFTEAKRQELTEKRVKSITKNEIKRFNQVMDMITQQVNTKSTQSQNEISSQTLLSNIASMIQRQKNKASQELKLYQAFNDKKSPITQKKKHENDEKIDQNQIINSFKNKINKKLSNLERKNFEQKVLLSENSQSLSSNHLQKTKISQLNLQEIQTGLCKRLHEIEFKRDHELSVITEKFINDKITAKQYHEEKQIIEKWCQVESKKLKKIKKNLIQGYKKAKDCILRDQESYGTKLTRQKSNKMIESISEKYLFRKKLHSGENEDKSQRLNHIEFKEYREELMTIDFEVGRRKQGNIIQKMQYIVDQDRSCSSELDEESKGTDSPHIQSKYEVNPESGSQAEITVNIQNEFYNEKSFTERIHDESQMKEDHLVHSSTYQEDELIRGQFQSDNDSTDLENDNYLHQSDAQNLLHLEEPHQLNIVINKRTALSSHEYLFSPKKLRHHEQLSEQLQQYSSLNEDQEQQSLSFHKISTKVNPSFLKLKHLTEQDKQDIFEFIFLDLTLEILLDESKNSPIMKSIEKYLVYLRKKQAQAKGFKTGLETCKIYINHMKRFLETNYFSTLKRLQSPIGPSPRQMLKFMREDDDTQFQVSQLQVQILVLPIQVYEQFQLEQVNILQVERYFEDQERQFNRIKFLINMKRFHTKALFDSLNEMLDLQRNFGLWGKPFPWKKALSIDRKLSDSQLKQKLFRAAQKVIENCSYLCGLMLDKEESVFGRVRVSEEYLQHVRQDRMSKMLSNEMVDNEVRWTFYDDEEVEVLESISKSMMSKLMNQVVLEIQQILLTKTQ